MQQGDDAEPLISVSEAARALGLNKSTLSRQIAKGSLRSHQGKVRLSEVTADRLKRLYPGRARRREGLTDGQAYEAERATKAGATECNDACPVADAVAHLRKMFLRSAGIIAHSALHVGVSAKQAFAIAYIARAELACLGDDVMDALGCDLETASLELPPITSTTLGFKRPNDLAECEAFVAALPYYTDADHPGFL